MSLRGNSVPLDCPSLVRGCSLWREVCGVYSFADPIVFPGLLIWTPPYSCSCWSVCLQWSLPCSPLSLSTYLFMSYAFIFIFGYCPGIVKSLQPAQPVGTRPGICSMAVRARRQGQRVNGYKGSHHTSWLLDTLCYSCIGFVSVPLLPSTPPGQGGRSRAFPRRVMAEFCQEYRNFVLMHLDIRYPNIQTSGNWKDVIFLPVELTNMGRLQILERTWFWPAQAACAYHFVGRE